MEKRFLNIEEFRKFAGGIGRSKAYELAKISGARVCFGRRIVVDSEKFTEWAIEQRG